MRAVLAAGLCWCVAFVSIEGIHFHLEGHDVVPAEAQAALTAAEALHDGFVKRFGGAPLLGDQGPRIELFASIDDLARDPRAAGRKLQGILLPGDVILVAHETQAGQDLTLWHLRHEVGHLLWRRLGGLGGDGEPWVGAGYWLVEGLAAEMESGPAVEDIEVHRLRIAHQALLDEDLPPLGSLLQLEPEPFQAQGPRRTNIHYAAAWALAHHLLARAPAAQRERFRTYIRAARGLAPERRRPALFETLELSQAELERDWRSGIKAAGEQLREEQR